MPQIERFDLVTSDVRVEKIVYLSYGFFASWGVAPQAAEVQCLLALLALLAPQAVTRQLKVKLSKSALVLS